ncbi:hypothetical protein IAR50_001485 [Cryptococcus sp. DSM 104548]
MKPVTFADLVKIVWPESDPPIKPLETAMFWYFRGMSLGGTKFQEYIRMALDPEVERDDIDDTSDLILPSTQPGAPKRVEKLPRPDADDELNTPARSSGAFFALMEEDPPNPYLAFQIGDCPETVNVKTLYEYEEGQKLKVCRTYDFIHCCSRRDGVHMLSSLSGEIKGPNFTLDSLLSQSLGYGSTLKELSRTPVNVAFRGTEMAILIFVTDDFVIVPSPPAAASDTASSSPSVTVAQSVENYIDELHALGRGLPLNL